jgi:hypothetical protein
VSTRQHASWTTAALMIIGLVSLQTPKAGAQTTASAPKPAPAAGAGQTKASAQKRALPRTPDGKPDLSGTWSFATLTPVERPAELADKQTLTDEDVANAEAEIKEIATERVTKRKTRITNKLDTTLKTGDAGEVGFYNQFWLEPGTKLQASRQTSLIVDPPDGKIPPFTPEGARRMAAMFAARERNAGPEDRSPVDRCILGFNAGPPMVPGQYNNNVQIFQQKGHLAILNEMIHSARIVPLDGRPHGTARQWLGDSRGRWEGETLVIDTINFRDEGLAAESPKIQTGDRNTHLIERFTRLDPDTLLYEFTIDDPSVWTKPWTARFAMTRSSERIYEYACHEGNHAMTGILAGARADEKKAAEGSSGK